jgi:hypothetical protein
VTPDQETLLATQLIEVAEKLTNIDGRLRKLETASNSESDWPMVVMLGLLLVSAIIIILGMTWLVTK